MQNFKVLVLNGSLKAFELLKNLALWLGVALVAILFTYQMTIVGLMVSNNKPVARIINKAFVTQLNTLFR
jgi:hypothetical protein